MFHKKKNNLALKTLPIVVLVMMGFVCFSYYSEAESIEDIEETQEKLEELDKEAEKIREKIEVNLKQQESLSSQISVMDSSIYKAETEIENNKRQIAETNSQISRTEIEIRDKEETIFLQKKVLADLLKVFYEYRRKNIFAIVVSSEALGPFMAKKDKLAQTGEKIRDLLGSVKLLKSSLEEKKNNLEEDRNKLADLHLNLQERTTYLENNKSQKNILLTKTQGEEEKYRELLEKIEAQKLELLNINELYAISGLSVDDFEKPDEKYHASLSWFYSQHDSKWGDVKIGNSKSLLKDYGCAVSSVAMVFTYQGSAITPKLLAEKDQYFQWDLIAWPQSWKNINLSSNGSRHGNLSWSIINNEIENKNPVIVYIGKSGGKGGHYVVIHHKDKKGRYVVHDPYFGPNIFLDTSRALVGAMGIKTSTYMDQMIIYN